MRFMLRRNTLLLLTLAVGCVHGLDQSIRENADKADGSLEEWFRQTARREAILHQRRAAANSSKQLATPDNYACESCLTTYEDNTPVTLRVMFLKSKDTVTNVKADEAAEAAGLNHVCGSCCDDPVLAVPECFVVENWKGGWIGEPVVALLNSLGPSSIVAMTPANISDEVFTVFASEGVTRGTNGYTTCVLDLALGNVDLCVGSFWETAPRRDRVLFTSPLDINNFRLVTVAKLETGFGPGNLIDIFAPFSWTVWWCVLGMFIFTALCMWAVNHEPTEDFPEEHLFPHPMGIVKGVWVSAMGYFAGNQFVVDRWSTRLIVLGFSFFLYISGASYTANLASFMVLKAGASVGIGSFADIVRQNRKVCVPPEITGMVTASTSGIESQMVVRNSVDVLLDNMHRGECDAAVIGKLEFTKFVTAESASYTICTTEGDFNYLGGYFCGGKDSTLQLVELSKCLCDSVTIPDSEECPADCHPPSTKYCDVVVVPDDSFDGSLNFAFPVLAWLEPYVSAWIVKMKQEGQIGKAYETQFRNRNPDKCPATSPQGQGASSTADAGASSLGIESMAGTFFFAGILMLSGIALHAGQEWQERARVGRVESFASKAGEGGGAVGVADGKGGGGGDIGAVVGKVEELQREVARLAAIVERSQGVEVSSLT